MKKSCKKFAGFFACNSVISISSKNTIRKSFLIVILLFMCLISVRSEHYMGVSAGFVSPMMSDGLSLTSPRMGYGGMIGGEWLYKKNRFTFELGLQAVCQQANLTVSDETLQFSMRDTQDKPFVYNGYLKGRRESLLTFDLQVPLLFGLEYDYVYASLGAIGVYTLTGSTRQTALLTTTGDYDRYYETLTDMPNHGFYDLQPVRGKSRLGSDWDVRLYGEVGAVWHTPLTVSTSVRRGKYRGARSSKRELKWRAGVFVGYGLRDLTGSAVYRYSGNSYGNGNSNGNSISNAGVPMTEVDPTRYMAVTLHSVYSSREAVDTRLNQLSFGIRLTILFPLSSSRYSFRSCNCVYL